MGLRYLSARVRDGFPTFRRAGRAVVFVAFETAIFAA
jgi:hypothetical protein